MGLLTSQVDTLLSSHLTVEYGVESTILSRVSENNSLRQEHHRAA